MMLLHIGGLTPNKMIGVVPSAPPPQFSRLCVTIIVVAVVAHTTKCIVIQISGIQWHIQVVCCKSQTLCLEVWMGILDKLQIAKETLMHVYQAKAAESCS